MIKENKTNIENEETRDSSITDISNESLYNNSSTFNKTVKNTRINGINYFYIV